MHKFKRLSLIMCVTWSILLVLIITFGTTVSSKISKTISRNVNDSIAHLKDVVVEVADFYAIEKEYRLKYEVKPQNDADYELVFTSLNDDIFSVDKNGVIKGKRLESDSNTGTLQITSNKYPDFIKTYNLTFKKIYPTDFNTIMYGAWENDNYRNAYLGVPIYVKPEIISNETVTELNVSLKYDETYFDYTELSKNYYRLIPKVGTYEPGDDFTKIETKISLVVNEIEKESNVYIHPSKNPAKLDELLFVNSNNQAYDDQINFNVGDNIRLKGYLDGSEISSYPYKLSSTNENVVKVDSSNNLIITGPGNTTIKYEIPNGTVYEKNINVIRKLYLPTFEGVDIVDDTIHIKSEERKKITIKSNSKSFTTITFNSEKISSSYQTYSNFDELYLVGYYGNTGTIDIVVDDGFTKITKTYKIVVDKNKKSPTEIARRINTFIHKVAGHMGFFALEAFLAFWMFTNYHFKKKWINIVIYFTIGIFLGSLTEFIQYFMPSRTSRVLDVVIDMGGYLVGCLAFLALCGIINVSKKRKGGQNEKLE